MKMANDFEACLAESGTVAFRVAFRLLRSREDAEDVSQEAVIRALERFDSLRDRNSFRAWLVRVAFRLAIDRRRSDFRRAGRDTHLVSTGVVEADAERDLIARERAAHIRAAVDQLPAKLRTPLVLGNMEGHSLDEVAALLQLPSGTVKSRSFQARKRLKQQLTKAGVALALFAGTLFALQQLSVVERRDWPAIARLENSPSVSLPAIETETAVLQALPGAAQAPVIAREQARVDPSKLAIDVPAVEVPVIVIPLVKIPAVQVRTVETATVTVPSGLVEKQR